MPCSTLNLVTDNVSLLFISGTDLALLAAANHSILTYGTFGMWGALLGQGGEVVLPKGYEKLSDQKSIEQANLSNWAFI